MGQNMAIARGKVVIQTPNRLLFRVFTPNNPFAHPDSHTTARHPIVKMVKNSNVVEMLYADLTVLIFMTQQFLLEPAEVPAFGVMSAAMSDENIRHVAINTSTITVVMKFDHAAKKCLKCEITSKSRKSDCLNGLFVF